MIDQIISLEQLPLIGESSNSKIYALGNLALKIIPHPLNECKRECEHLQNECKIVQNFQSNANILQVGQLYCNQSQIEIECNNNEKQKLVLQNVNGCALLMEYAQQGDLVDLVNKNMKNFYCLDLIKKIFKQVVEGLCDIHNKGYAHNDIKLENIFVGQQFDVKIGDFGFSKRFWSTRGAQIQAFKNRRRDFLAPEILELIQENEEKNMENLNVLDFQKGDVYALGISMLQAFAKVMPFKNANSLERQQDVVYEAFVSRNFKKFWKFFPKQYLWLQKAGGQFNREEDVQEFFDLIVDMIQPNVYDRLDIQSVMSHKFFQQFS